MKTNIVFVVSNIAFAVREFDRRFGKLIENGKKRQIVFDTVRKNYHYFLNLQKKKKNGVNIMILCIFF